MRQTFLSMLLLVAVALSSSKVLPLLSTSQLNLQLLGTEGQQNDNTYSYSDQNVLNNIIYNIPIDTPDYIQRDFDRSQINYNNRDGHNYNIINMKDNRNGDGFRKEQWHNYPRQLDRLHKYLGEQNNYDKRNLDPDEIVGDEDDSVIEQDGTEQDGLIKEPLIYTTWNPKYDIARVNREANPFINLNLLLAGLSKNVISEYDNFKPITQELGLVTNGLKEQDNQIFTNGIYPAEDFIDNERQDETPHGNDTKDESAEENKTVSKRIFALWSRVQGMSHKGHEILQRRRHMHTFYGMQDGDGSRALTAETRAILMRPPGSPLRWG